MGKSKKKSKVLLELDPTVASALFKAALTALLIPPGATAKRRRKRPAKVKARARKGAKGAKRAAA